MVKPLSWRSVPEHAAGRHLAWGQWSSLCKIDAAQDNGERQHADYSREGEDTMDFGIILLVSNTLMAIFIYVVVKLIWQD